MVNLRAALAIAASLLAFPAYGSLPACDEPAEQNVWHSNGPAVRALVELWWTEKRQPMRQAPDGVVLKSLSDDHVSIIFLRNGCRITEFRLPTHAVSAFLARRLGPSI